MHIDGANIIIFVHVMDSTSSNSEKVAFFRSLFDGRNDVFAKRFENSKTGKKGYSPCCENQWKRGVCSLAKGWKCLSCPNRKFQPYSEDIVRWHLRGFDSQNKPFELGVYPMDVDETVAFAVIDFDKSTWRRDTLAVAKKVREVDLPVAIERSRSGKGAHIWFFFSERISAKSVRAALSYILTLTLEAHPEISLDSYDRIIPNQGTLPKGGFGNLIALPLQAAARKIDNSVFVNDDWVAYKDQWKFLASVRRIEKHEIFRLIDRSKAEHRTVVEMGYPIRDEMQPWTSYLPLWSAGASNRDGAEVPGKSIDVVLANRIYVSQEKLTDEIRGRLIRAASFVNPEFHKIERMKRSVYGTPRIISRALNGEKYLELPRGCLDEVNRILSEGGFTARIEDKRYSGIPLDVTFHGNLRPIQEAAIGTIQKYDNGILAAGTAFGKTIVAINMIARRKVNTLVLVNRRQLQAQWISKIAAFLGIDEKSIGKIGGGADRWTGNVDVALIQSLSRKGHVDSRIKEYGQIIVDECHAVGAESFEALLDAAPCRYILGLSATVVRNDGHDPLVIMQLGPIRYKVDAKLLATSAPFAHTVYVRQTSFRMRHLREDVEFNYADMIKELTSDNVRNQLIADDVVAAVAEGRSPVILTDRKEQVHIFENLLSGRVKHVVVMTGGMGIKVSRAKLEELKSIKDSEERVVISTGSYIGEGFDDSRMDTLFLATPVSWKGRLTQYAGRLHRLQDGKKEVRIYDYLDSNIAVCEKMFEKRRTGYDAIGYTIMVPKGATEGWPADVVLPVEPRWNERFSTSVRRLCRDGVDVALADLFLRATLSLSGDDDDRCRINSKGAVLRFFQKRLNTLNGQMGQFKEGVRLPISCGINPHIEVDLWNDEKKFAVMLDSREELSDVELYRIARYEDALLHKTGIKVFRFLVEDVCERLHDVLHQITHLL